LRANCSAIPLGRGEINESGLIASNFVIAQHHTISLRTLALSYQTLTRARRAELAGDLQGAVRVGEAVGMAKRLRRANPKTGKRLSFRKISAELAAAGYLNERGAPYQAVSVKRMLET